MTTDNKPTNLSTTLFEFEKNGTYSWNGASFPEDDHGTFSTVSLGYTEQREGRDTDQSFMDYYMGGGPMVTEGQEVKLFVTEVLRETKRVTVTMNWRLVRQAEERVTPPAVDLYFLESLQQWFVAYASGAGGEPEFSNIKSWTKALAAITGQPVPKRWED